MQTMRFERGTIAGGISILMIFLTLCITVYGLLSLLTARSEKSLNEKNRAATEEYYAADSSSLILVSEIISARLKDDISSFLVDRETPQILYESTTDTASFLMPIDAYRNLYVSVTFTDDDEYIVNNYNVTNNLEWWEQIEDKLDLITVFN